MTHDLIKKRTKWLRTKD